MGGRTFVNDACPLISHEQAHTYKHMNKKKGVSHTTSRLFYQSNASFSAMHSKATEKNDNSVVPNKRALESWDFCGNFCNKRALESWDLGGNFCHTNNNNNNIQ